VVIVSVLFCHSRSMNTTVLQIVLLTMYTMALAVNAKSLERASDPLQGVDGDESLMHSMTSHQADDIEGLGDKTMAVDEPISWRKPVDDEVLHWAEYSKRVGRARSSLNSHRRNDVYGVAGRFGRSADFKPVIIEV